MVSSIEKEESEFPEPSAHAFSSSTNFLEAQGPSFSVETILRKGVASDITKA
jgi:hypothetical protein